MREFEEGNYLVIEDGVFRRAIMSDLDRAKNAMLYIWRDGRAHRLGHVWYA